MRRFHGLFAALLVASAIAMPEPSSAVAKLAVRTAIGLPLIEALKAIQAMNFALALEEARLADSATNKSPFEEYAVAQYLCDIALAQPMPDYTAARAAYDRIMSSGGIPDQDRASLEEWAMKLRLGEGR